MKINYQTNTQRHIKTSKDLQMFTRERIRKVSASFFRIMTFSDHYWFYTTHMRIGLPNI